MQMKDIFKLTDTEQAIMELLWELDQPLSLREMVDYLNEKLHKQWKNQTVGTYLSHLQQEGLIRADKRGVRFYIYEPTCTKEEYKQMCVRKLVEKSFDNSIANFVAAFTGGKRLSKEEADDLRKLL